MRIEIRHKINFAIVVILVFFSPYVIPIPKESILTERLSSSNSTELPYTAFSWADHSESH